MKRILLLWVIVFWAFGNGANANEIVETDDNYGRSVQNTKEIVETDDNYGYSVQNVSPTSSSVPSSITPSSSTSGFGGGPNDLSKTSFMFDTNALSPTQNKYTGGTKANFTKILGNIGKYLLIATTTLAVLSITIGGIMIATTWPSDRAAKGKTIINLNIMAIVIALLSYSIIQFVRWVLSV